MRQILMLSFALMLVSLPAFADPASLDMATKLNNRLISAYLSAQTDRMIIKEKIKQDGPKTEVEIDRIVRKHGFKDWSEYENADLVITAIMEAFDVKTKTFVGLNPMFKKAIDAITADKTKTEEEKKELVESLKKDSESWSTDPMWRQSNIDLIVKYYDRLTNAVRAAEATTQIAANTSQVFSSAAFSLDGLWKNDEHGLQMTLEKLPNGTLVIKQANPSDKYSFVGDITGEARPREKDVWRGQHMWGGRRTNNGEWGLPDGLLIRRITDDIIFLQYLDSKYQGGWEYHRQK